MRPSPIEVETLAERYCHEMCYPPGRFPEGWKAPCPSCAEEVALVLRLLSGPDEDPPPWKPQTIGEVLFSRKVAERWARLRGLPA